MTFVLGKLKSLRLLLPFAHSKVHCGFPSPADPYLDHSIDLNDELGCKRPECFLVRADGDSMVPTIFKNDLLIVDRSLKPRNNSIIICYLEGEFIVKRVYYQGSQVKLSSDNKAYKDIFIRDSSLDDFIVWGVVSHIIHETK